MLQIKFQASYQAVSDFSPSPRFRSFRRSSLWSLATATTAESFVSAAFLRRTLQKSVRARGCTTLRELGDAFGLHFIFQRRDATYISTTTVDAQRFSILFASNLVCGAISFSVNAAFLSYSIITCRYKEQGALFNVEISYNIISLKQILITL